MANIGLDDIPLDIRDGVKFVHHYHGYPHGYSFLAITENHDYLVELSDVIKKKDYKALYALVAAEAPCVHELGREPHKMEPNRARLNKAAIFCGFDKVVVAEKEISGKNFSVVENISNFQEIVGSGGNFSYSVSADIVENINGKEDLISCYGKTKYALEALETLSGKNLIEDLAAAAPELSFGEHKAEMSALMSGGESRTLDFN